MLCDIFIIFSFDCVVDVLIISIQVNLPLQKTETNKNNNILHDLI